MSHSPAHTLTRIVQDRRSRRVGLGTCALLLFINLVCFAAPPGRLHTAQETNVAATPLIPNQPVAREIKGGQTDEYLLTLAPAQFVRVVVEQQGADVALRLFDTNSQLAESDSPNGRTGTEEFAFISQAGGTYRVQVFFSDTKAAPGRYQIEVAEFHAATTADTLRAEADQALREGLALYAQGKAEGYQQAGAKFEAAHALFLRAADKRGQARSLHLVAESYSAVGNRNKTLEYLKLATPLWRELGDQRQEAEALNSTGASYLMLGDQPAAIDYFNLALPLFHGIGDRGEEAVVINNLAASNARLGESQKALEYYLRALPPIRESKNTGNECIILGNIAGQYFRLGDKETGRQYMEQAQGVCRGTKNKRQESTFLGGLGFYYLNLGDLPKATEAFRQGLALDETTGFQVGLINEHIGLGRVLYLTGDYAQARAHFDTALKLSQAANLKTGVEDATFLLGTVAFAAGEPEQAHKLFNEALELSRAIAEKMSEANALHMVATVEIAEGQRTAAREHLEAALEIIESERKRVNAPDLRSSVFAERQEFYELYIDLLMREHQLNPDKGYAALALQAAERARARTLLDMLVESRANIREGIAPALLERAQKTERLLAQKADEVTRELSRESSEERRAAVQQELAKLRAEYNQVQAEIRATSPRYAALTQPRPLALAEIQGQLLDKDTLLLEYALGEKRSYLFAVTQNSLKTFELPPREEIERAARRVYDLLIARNRRVRFETVEERRARLAQAESEWPQAAAALSRMLLASVAPQLGVKRLLVVSDGALQYIPFASLPAPAEQSGSGKATQSPTPNPQPLIARHEIINLPSATTLAVLRNELSGRVAAPKLVAVLADPVFGFDDERLKQALRRDSVQLNATAVAQARTRGEDHLAADPLTRAARDVNGEEALNLARLPFTRREAEAITALAPEARRKEALDFAANRETATGAELGQYRIVHFATHGFLNSAHPDLSGLIFSLVDDRGNSVDGFLRAHEIYNLKLPADMIVLSGCRTGLGKEVRGEGLVGLTRGFMYAGAARVVVSLWDVNDEATAELMKRFYGELLGARKLSPAAALRAAQVSMAQDKRWSAPYYWAAFTLQGEPR